MTMLTLAVILVALSLAGIGYEIDRFRKDYIDQSQQIIERLSIIADK